MREERLAAPAKSTSLAARLVAHVADALRAASSRCPTTQAAVSTHLAGLPHRPKASTTIVATPGQPVEAVGDDGQHHLQDGFDSVDHLDEEHRSDEPLQIL